MKSHILLVISFLIICFFTFMVVHMYFERDFVKKYRELKNFYDNNFDTSRKCPPGCKGGYCENKGVCRNPFPPNPKCCAFDGQCSGCTNKKGKVVERRNRFIKDHYYNNYKNISKLNKLINRENKYIKHLNKKIIVDNQV